MPRNAVTNRFRTRDFVSSLLFNGTTDTVIVPHNANQLLTNGFTLSAWIRPRTLGESSLGNVIDKSTGLNGADGYVFQLTGTAQMRLRVDSISVNSATNSVVLNRWQHVLVTVAADATVTHYINGAVSGTPSATAALSAITTTNALTIGNRSGVTDRTFDGWIDEPLVWNRVLTAQEISNLYLLGDIPTSGLVWGSLFNEGAGSTVTDISSTANNGTITGATYSADVPMKARKQINGNMVKNGDFEYAPPFTAATTTSSRWIDGTASGSTTNSLFGYFMVIGGSVTGSAQFDTAVKRNGNASLKIVSTVANAGSSVGMYVGLTNQSAPSIANQIAYMIPVTPNTSYTFTGYIKTDSLITNDATGARFNIVEYTGASTSNSGSTASTYVSGTTDWTLRTINFTTSSTSRWVNVQMYILGDSTGTAWFDDISLTPVYPEGRVPANGNLVKNFDFEVIPAFTAAGTTSSRWIDGTAAGSSTNATYKWSQIIDATSCAISIDGTVSHSGSGSLKVDCLDATGRGRGCYGSRTGTGASLLVSELNLYAIRVPPSTGITMTYWIKTLNVQGGGAKIAVHEHDGAGVRVTSTSATAVAGTADWQQITFTVTTSATTQYLVLSAEIPTAGAAQTAWFDDIYLAPTTNPGRIAIT